MGKKIFRTKALPGVPGSIVEGDDLNHAFNIVPTGEDRDGSAPLLYAADTGVANAYEIELVFGKQQSAGTNDDVAADKLKASGATFSTDGVKAGDTALNLDDRTSAKVLSVDSDGQLSLDAHIFTATPKRYAVGPGVFQSPIALVDGMKVAFKAGNANTGASTLNVNGLGAKSIKKNYNNNPAAGDIVAGQIIEVTYDSTGDVFHMSNLAIMDGSITTAKLAASAVNSDKLAALAVTTDKLADEAVTGDKIEKTKVSSDNPSIAEGGYWTPLAGVYCITASGGSTTLELYVAGWQGNAEASGLIISDGSNVRVRNSSGAGIATLYYLEF